MLQLVLLEEYIIGHVATMYIEALNPNSIAATSTSGVTHTPGFLMTYAPINQPLKPRSMRNLVMILNMVAVTIS